MSEMRALRECLEAINNEFVDPLEPWGPDLELPRDWLLRVREVLAKDASGDGCVEHGLAHPCEACAAQTAYEQVLADHDRLVRELDVLLNGEAGAAKQASLCDIVGQIRDKRWRLVPAGRPDHLPQQILNLACKVPFPLKEEPDEARAYQRGHKDARHAAAEIAAARL